MGAQKVAVSLAGQVKNSVSAGGWVQETAKIGSGGSSQVEGQTYESSAQR